MNKGDYIRTPRFCTVQIKEVFQNEDNARKAGFTEPTHYKNSEYGIYGKSIDIYTMEFAAFKK